jgi:hypothetical protein
MKTTAIATALTALFCVAAQAQVIERMKLTDNEMSCQMIYGEIRQMESFMAAAPAAGETSLPAAPSAAEAVGAQVVQAVGQQALAQVAARSGLGGLFGGLMGGGATATVPQQAQQAAATQQALAIAAAQGRVSPAAVQGLGGLLGGLSALASQQQAPQAVAPAAAAPAAGLGAQAGARKEHLTTLFLAKGCKLGDVSR